MIKALGIVLSSLVPLTSSSGFGSTPKPDLSREKVLYVVGYAHLDTQWLWTYKVSIDEFIRRTLDDNFTLFDKYPAYNFNFTGSVRYEMMKEYYPERYERLKQYIRNNRWFVSGSSVDEGDVNVPSAEAIFRQILLGNNYFRKEFGRESVDYMLPDCFGFPASMPSIWAHAGLKGFSTQKLTWGSAVGIPFNVGMWEGPDGKAIVAALNPGAYVGSVDRPLHTDPEWVQRVNDNGLKYGVFADYHYYGVGDQGGAPRENDVKNIVASLGNDGQIKVLSAPSDQLYKDLTEEQKAQLPRYKGDMLLTEHSAGTLTSQAYMKRWNRHNELLADSAERASVMAQVTASTPYPQEKLNTSWVRVLGSQMHDILPGTSIPKAYEYSYNDEVVALNGFAASLQYGVGSLAHLLDTEVTGKALVVYNPLSMSRRDVVEARVDFPEGAPQGLAVYTSTGTALPAQITERTPTSLRFIFMPELSPLSAEVFDVRPLAGELPFSSPVSAAGKTLANEFLQVELNAAGDIAHIRDTEHGGREVLEKPSQLVFQYEQPRDFPSWNMDWKDRKLPPYAVVDGAAEIRLVENGPLRVTVEVKRQKLGSTFVQRVSLLHGSRVVFVQNSFDWLTRNSSLKASFPLTIANPLATYNWGLGTVQRNNNHPKKYEVPSHQWFDLTLADGSYGVSIIEDSKFGSDKPSDNELRLTLLYTPNTASGGFHYEASQDWGHHDFTYGIYPHAGDWRSARSHEQGERLNQKPFAFVADKHQGVLGKSYSFLQVSTPQVAVRAVKKAEDGSAIIVRVQELWGQAARGAKLQFGAPIARAWEVDGQERPLGEIAYGAKELSFDLSSFSPRSFAIEFAPSTHPAVRVRSVPLGLPYNARMVSRDGEAGVGGMDGQGALYPAEQFPRVIESEGVRFVLGHGQQQAVVAEGQTIELPQGDYNRLYILAAAQADSEAEFIVDESTHKLAMQQWFGQVGDYDNRVWGPNDTVLSITPGFIKRAPIAWFATHRHLPGGQNDSYTFSYLFKHSIPLAPGAKQLTLPLSNKNNKIVVFAVSVAKDPSAGIAEAAPLYDDFTGRRVVQP